MKFSKRILITSLTLVLMVVALGVGVFAWFTMNTRTKAGNLTGTAKKREKVDFIFHLMEQIG